MFVFFKAVIYPVCITICGFYYFSASANFFKLINRRITFSALWYEKSDLLLYDKSDLFQQVMETQK